MTIGTIPNHDAIVTTAPATPDGLCFECLRQQVRGDFEQFIAQFTSEQLRESKSTNGVRLFLDVEIEAACCRIEDLAEEGARGDQGCDRPCHVHADRKEDDLEDQQ